MADEGGSSAAPGPDTDLEELLESFARAQEVDDPVLRRIVLRREAERLRLDVDYLTGLFELYSRRSAAPKWLLERYAARLVAWAESLSFFSLLEYVGRLAIVLAIVSFFIDLPERHQQQQYSTWETVESASGKEYSRARINALEELGEDCVSLEGLNARGADLRGLRLDRCYSMPGGFLLGRWAPRVFRRQGAILLGADLGGSHLEEARLPQADLRRADLSGSFLREASLEAARLEGARLPGADLFRADLRGAHLAGADLRNAHLVNADLRGADLSRARLEGADLVGADLRGAVLQYAHLAGATLSRSDLRRTDLFYAELERARFQKARLDDRTVLEKAGMIGADFRKAFLGSRDQLQSARDWRSALLDAPGQEIAHRPPTLGLILQDEQYFFKEIGHGARLAVEPGARLIVRVAGSGPGNPLEREATLVRELLGLGVDALVLAPQDERKSVPVLREAFHAGVVIVSYDHSLNFGDAPRLLAGNYESDQLELGHAAGKALAKQLRRRPAGKPLAVGILKYCEFEGCYRRVKGFRAALDETGIRWREAGYRGVRSGESSASAANALLAEHPEVSVVWSANENATESLVEAVRARGLAGRVQVWGVDISPTLARMLLAPDNVLQAVVGQRPEEMGYQAARAALQALRGRAPAFQSVYVPSQPFTRTDPGAVREYLKRRGIADQGKR